MRRILRPLRALSQDRGFSIPELAVYIVLLGIISAIVAASVFGLFRSQKTVSSLTTAASESQILISVLNQDLRSARELSVRNGGTTVIASVASKSSPITWRCVTWNVAGTGSNLSITRNGKTMLQSAKQHGAAPFFATATGADVPQGKEGTLIYDFLAADKVSSMVAVDGTVSMEAQGKLGDPAQCI